MTGSECGKMYLSMVSVFRAMLGVFLILVFSGTVCTAQDGMEDFEFDMSEGETETVPAVTEDIGAEPEVENSEELAREYYNRGVELFMAKYVPQSVMYYKKAISLDPEMAAYHADLGEAYRMMGNNREAISELETAIKIAPDMVNAYTTLGVIYERENLPQLAIKYHRMAIKLDPEHYIAYNNLGHTYDMLGLSRAAIENYTEAIRIKSDFSTAYDNLGTSLMRIGKVEEGIEQIKKAIDIAGDNHPQVGLYYNDLGAAYAVLKEYEKAKGAFETALDKIPDNPEIMRNYMFIKEYLDGKSN